MRFTLKAQIAAAFGAVLFLPAAGRAFGCRSTADLDARFTACREQSVGIEQINRAVVQLDRATQADAGAATGMNATAEAPAGEAAALNGRGPFPDRGA